MTPPASSEEREAAMLAISQDKSLPWTLETIRAVEYGSERAMWTPLVRVAVRLQIALTRSEAKVAERDKLLLRIEKNDRDWDAGRFGDTCRAIRKLLGIEQ